MNKLFPITVAGVFLALVAGSFSASAATNTIQVGTGFNVFVPATTNIAQNNTVIWVWGGNLHSTTSDTGIWDSGLFNLGHRFTNTFPNVGTFPYFCTFHGAAGGIGMAGVITVSPASVPPTVTVTNPANGTFLSAPAAFILAASVAGSVTNVQFFQNTTTSLGNDSTIPYSMPVNGLAAGDYTFSAVASDNAGLKATNSITVHVVTPIPISLTNPQRLSASSFRFNYSANIGLKYVVQRSKDLFEWNTLVTNTAASNPETFTDGAATLNPGGYYRVGRLPNP